MKECEVLIQFPIESDEQLQHVFNAGKELAGAGITFDTGFGCGKCDWEFDWSLKGAKVLFKKFSDGKLPSGKPIKTE